VARPVVPPGRRPAAAGHGGRRPGARPAQAVRVVVLTLEGRPEQPLHLAATLSRRGGLEVDRLRVVDQHEAFATSWFVGGELLVAREKKEGRKVCLYRQNGPIGPPDINK
jgi:hypothetical protein